MILKAGQALPYESRIELKTAVAERTQALDPPLESLRARPESPGEDPRATTQVSSENTDAPGRSRGAGDGGRAAPLEARARRLPRADRDPRAIPDPGRPQDGARLRIPARAGEAGGSHRSPPRGSPALSLIFRVHDRE